MAVINKYGTYSQTQLEEYIKKMHKKLFWLLLYKDPETKDNYPNVDFDIYFKRIQTEINGLNSLLEGSPIVVEVMSILEGAFLLSHSDEYTYKEYRKLILDAHSTLDKFVMEG